MRQDGEQASSIARIPGTTFNNASAMVRGGQRDSDLACRVRGAVVCPGAAGCRVGGIAKQREAFHEQGAACLPAAAAAGEQGQAGVADQNGAMLVVARQQLKILQERKQLVPARDVLDVDAAEDRGVDSIQILNSIETPDLLAAGAYQKHGAERRRAGGGAEELLCLRNKAASRVIAKQASHRAPRRERRFVY